MPNCQHREILACSVWFGSLSPLPTHIAFVLWNQLGVVVDPCHPNGGWVMECQALQQVLHLMWMAHPNQADSLQGSQSGNVEVLAANDLGIGSGWQQSKQNWALSAVVGKWVRVICSDLCWRTTGVTHHNSEIVTCTFVLTITKNKPGTRALKKLFTLLDLCVSSLRRGHANLLCIVPILTDDPRRESER